MYGRLLISIRHASASVDWSFPSPTATPRNPLVRNVFETPKSSNLPTHFQDAFTTPQMQNYATPHPQLYHSTTPMQYPHILPETLQADFLAGLQTTAGHGAAGSAGTSSSQQNHEFSLGKATPAQTTSMYGCNMTTSFDSSQMQTPPPTRGASSKKTPIDQHIAFGTPSTIATRRLATPQQPVASTAPVHLEQTTPAPFPQLQLSPDAFQFTDFGPTSAPILPQSRILWVPDSADEAFSQSQLADPFAPTSSAHEMSWTTDTATMPTTTQNVSFDTPAMDSFPVQAPHPRPASAASASQPPIFSSLSLASNGVDPSLLYTSPARAVERPNSRQNIVRPLKAPVELPAPMPIASRAQHDPKFNPASSRAGAQLERATTVAHSRLGAHISGAVTDPRNRSVSLGQVPRTSSPVKRYNSTWLQSISESKPKFRASVVLTVDENGRARTETRQVDGSPTRSMKTRYPALFDSDSSDAESDGSGAALGMAPSFTAEKRSQRRFKAARLDPPVEDLEGLSLPRSHSSSSLRKGIPPSRAAVAAAAQLRRQGSLRKPSSGRSSKRPSVVIDTAPMDSQHSFVTLDGSEPLMESMSRDVTTEEGSSSSAAHVLAAHNRRWSVMSYDQQHVLASSLSPERQGLYINHGGMTGPQSQRSGPQPLLIRCICGAADDKAQPLVQCRSCTQYLHAPCVGLEDHHWYPTGFTCFLCTKPPSVSG